MSKFSTHRLLTRTLFRSIAQPTPALRYGEPSTRSLSQSSSLRTDSKDEPDSLGTRLSPPPSASQQPRIPSSTRSMDELARALAPRSEPGRPTDSLSDFFSRPHERPADTGGLEDLGLDSMKREADDAMEEYHFNVYAHKHNTHITLSKPNRDVITSLSTGNLGFKKGNRGTFDAAYQLGAYFLHRITQQGWHRKIQNMEVTLRGFGPGREAVTKILLGGEGRTLRHAIRRVSDGTRLKFGGTRSRKPRRL